MECLNCKEIFETNNTRRVFCSGKCKVAYHRKNKKKETVIKFDLKILYNEILDLAQKLSSGQIIAQPQKVYDAPKLPITFTDEPKQYEVPETDNLQVWKTEMNNCESLEELDYVGQRVAASGLNRWEQNILTKYGKLTCERKGFI